VFHLPKGGEKCWIFREELVKAIESHEINVDGKSLKVRVQDSPEKESKRGVFWKAVTALEGFVSKDSFILEPRTFSIHSASSHEKVGIVSEDAYEWDADKMKRLFPNVSLPELRRASSGK